jgi:hypothetical protein
MNVRTKGNPIVGIIVGLVFLIVSLQFFILPAVRATTNGVKTTGTVIKVESHHNSKGKTSYTSTIEFKTDAGEKISFSPAVSSSLARSKGQQVPIIYNKGNPREAVIDDMFSTWLFPGIFSFAGLAILASSTMAYLNKRSQKNTEMTGIYNPSQNISGHTNNPPPPGPII